MRRVILILGLLCAPLAAPPAQALSPPLRAQAEATLACALEDGGPGISACLAALAASPDLREAIACALRGRDPAGCLGLELGLLGACALAAGGSAEAAAGCLALRLAGQEAAKCLTAGVGVPGGCFGPGHELRRAARTLAAPDGALSRLRSRAAALLPGS